MKRVKAEIMTGEDGNTYLYNPFDFQDKVRFIHPHSKRVKEGVYQYAKKSRAVIHYGDSVCNEVVVPLSCIAKYV